MTKISQREARRLRKQVAAMEQRERTRIAQWNCDYPGGNNIMTVDMADNVGHAILSTAMSLGFTIVVKLDGSTVRYYAVKP